MADITDVMNAFVSTIAQVIYPNGTAEPSVTGVPVAIYPGWPQSAQLDQDLAAFATGGGRLHVTVFPTGTERNQTRYSNAWRPSITEDPTLTLSISGNAVTVGGSVSVPQNAGLIVEGLGYAYALTAQDTLTSIATALAALVPGASSAGAVITFPEGSRITAARAGGRGAMYREVRRQQKVIQITIWADTPGHREGIASPIDVALAAMEFVQLPDGSGARIIYQSSNLDDATQKANLYRRDLLFTAEFPTIQTIDATGVIITQENISGGPTDAAAALNVHTIYQ